MDGPIFPSNKGMSCASCDNWKPKRVNILEEEVAHFGVCEFWQCSVTRCSHCEHHVKRGGFQLYLELEKDEQGIEYQAEGTT